MKGDKSMARNILVVEDDNNISNLIKMYLDKEGFELAYNSATVYLEQETEGKN